MPIFPTSRRKTVRQPAAPIVTSEPLSRDEILRSIFRELPPPKEDEEDTPVVDSSPIVRLVNTLLIIAIERQATDLFFESTARATRVYSGIPGFLTELLAYPPHLHSPAVQRLQSMAGLSESDLTRPQAGIFRLRHNNQDFDFRTTWIPTQHGGKIHLRIHNRRPLSLSEQGIHPIFISDLMDSLNKKEGLMLFVGPPACGKTILASQLLWMLYPDKHFIHTLEWPIEVSLFGGTQTLRNPVHGPGPMEAVKAAIRAGADTFFLSAIEDTETAAAAFYAVEAGLGVVATMDLAYPERVGSMLETLGIPIERYRKFVKTIVAPHRLPALCQHCRIPVTVTEELRMKIFFPEDEVPEVVYTRNTEGCDACYKQGVLGSRQLLELWKSDGTSHKWLRYTTREEVIQGYLDIVHVKDSD